MTGHKQGVITMVSKPSDKKHDITDKKHDITVEDSFPASDPPASSGIIGPRGRHHGHVRPAPHRRDDDSRPLGSPTHERHATETAYQWEDEETPSRAGY
jgi:hypothetical protein